MKSEKVEYSRELEIVDLIISNKYPNIKGLMKRFEVSKRTIYRDLEYLKDHYDMPFEYDKNKKGYKLTDPAWKLKPLSLTKSELFSMATLLPLMDQYKNTPLEATFRSVMDKLIEMIPNNVEIDTSFKSHNVEFIKDPTPRISQEVFNNVFTAIDNKKTVELNYKSLSSNEHSTRLFDPYKVLCQKGNWYIIGRCHKRDKITTYALSRIKELNFTDYNFEIQKSFNINDYIDPEMGIWTNNKTVYKYELEFSPKINSLILERQWHKNQTCYRKEDGSVYLSFESNQFNEILYMVLGFGSAVKVLNPPELIEKVKNEAKILQEMYK